MAESVQFIPLSIPPDLAGSNFLVGTSGYHYDDWIGIFNPPKGMKIVDLFQKKLRADRLAWYQTYFSFVEINHTFYAMPQKAHFLDIQRRSKESMMYTVKVSKEISHQGNFDCARGKELMKAHIIGVSPLIEAGSLYSLLIQFEDHLFRKMAVLEYILAISEVARAQGVDVHVEFRHRSWHDMNVLTALKNAGIGICNTDIPDVSHAFPLKAYATSAKGYFRYSGKNLASWYPQKRSTSPLEAKAMRNERYNYNYSSEDIKNHTLGQIACSHKASTVAIAYNNHYQAQAIKNASENLIMLKQRLDSNHASEF